MRVRLSIGVFQVLYTEAVEPGTLELLKGLMSSKTLESFYLAGGTALALLTGHRQSIDLDLFAPKKLNIEELREEVLKLGDVDEQSFSEDVIYQVFVSGIKIDFVSYRYELIEPLHIVERFRLASLADIAAMKIGAIAGRGSKKDFYDLIELLNHYKLNEILKMYKRKFPSSNMFHAVKSLTYFEDAEGDPEPKLLKKLSWQNVRSILSSEVRKLA